MRIPLLSSLRRNDSAFVVVNVAYCLVTAGSLVATRLSKPHVAEDAGTSSQRKPSFVRSAQSLL